MALLHHSIARFAPDAPRRLLVLHGIFGQGRNWSTVANVLVQLRPDWEVALADLRMHGKSLDFAAPHTLAACAEDVAALADSLGGITAILGHSFGAKVVLAHLQAGRLPAQSWIVDADPSARPPAGESMQMLALLRSLPPDWETRERFVGALMESGLTPAVAGWMATNLVREGKGKGFRLGFDLDAIESLLRDYFASDFENLVRNVRTDLRVVRATGSPILDDVEPRLRTAGVRVHTVAGGHWLNAENPSGVAQLLAAELPRE